MSDDYGAALFLAGVISVGMLLLAGLAAFLESTPERKAKADRLAHWLFD